MQEKTLHDYFLEKDLVDIVGILKNLDFLTLKLFINSKDANNAPVNLFRNICQSLIEVGDIIYRYEMLRSLGIELSGLSIQLFDYSDNILYDEECITLLEVIVQENYEFFKNAKDIPLYGYEKHLKPTVFENMRELLKRLPNRE